MKAERSADVLQHHGDEINRKEYVDWLCEKSTGFYQKYNVSRTDGRSAPGEKHADCQYFVLDLTHDPFAVAALEAYLEALPNKPTAFSMDLDQVIRDLKASHDTEDR